MESSLGKSVTVATGAVSTLYDELWRYLVVSALALGVDYMVLVGLTELAGAHYLVSGAAGFLMGAGIAYLGSVRWVFAHRKLGNPTQEMAIFALIGVGGLGITEAALWFFTDAVGFHYSASKIGAAGLGFTFNFVVRKYLLFR